MFLFETSSEAGRLAAAKSKGLIKVLTSAGALNNGDSSGVIRESIVVLCEIEGVGTTSVSCKHEVASLVCESEGVGTMPV